MFYVKVVSGHKAKNNVKIHLGKTHVIIASTSVWIEINLNKLESIRKRYPDPANTYLYTARQNLKLGGNHRCERSFSMDSELLLFMINS